MQAWLAVLLLMVIVAAVLPVVRTRRARRRQLADLALRSGWTYTPSDPWDLPGAIEGLWLGAWGHDRRCRDVFSVPAENGSLWLALFRRQMASGRHRRSECFAIAVARVRNIFGGIALLPQAQMFVPADPFARYRPVTALEGIDLSHRQLWAERPAGECHILSLLAAMMSSLPPDAGLEVRGQWAVVYWPLPRPAPAQARPEPAQARPEPTQTPPATAQTRPGSAQEFLKLHVAGRRLLELLSPGAGAPPAPAGIL